jgi:hypothetical protein
LTSGKGIREQVLEKATFYRRLFYNPLLLDDDQEEREDATPEDIRFVQWQVASAPVNINYILRHH